MARGNQRELAREKAAKKLQKTKKAPEESVTQRRERDAEALREKQKRKEEEKAAQVNGEHAQGALVRK